MNKTYIFYINGMHCKSCELVIESDLRAVPLISSVKASLQHKVVEVTGDFGELVKEQVAEMLAPILINRGYSLLIEQQSVRRNWSDFKIGIPAAFVFIAIFIILQKLGIVNLINVSSVSYSTAFIVGVVASLSTCMAVVGGLLLSMSALLVKAGEKFRPHVLFHLGRLVSFFLLGGVIGLIGSAFTLTNFTTFLLSFLVGLVMLVLGINLLDVFHWTKRIQPVMPKFLLNYTWKISKFNHTFVPLLVGIITFFLPCGFTQSMQIYTLTLGNFLQGGLTMFFFALGTLPVLALISFGSFSIQHSSKVGIFLKAAGLVVIMFALFNLINSLVVIGFLPPVFSF